jgi:hypothetical protein
MLQKKLETKRRKINGKRNEPIMSVLYNLIGKIFILELTLAYTIYWTTKQYNYVE